jgi:hypothetical protein
VGRSGQGSGVRGRGAFNIRRSSFVVRHSSFIVRRDGGGRAGRDADAAEVVGVQGRDRAAVADGDGRGGAKYTARNQALWL